MSYYQVMSNQQKSAVYRSAIVTELVSVIGDEATEALIEEWGGTRFFVSGSPDSPVAELIGTEAVAKLVAHFGFFSHTAGSDRLGKQTGFRLELPIAMGRPYPEIVFDRSVSARQAALMAGVHERTIYRLRASAKRDGGSSGPVEGVLKGVERQEAAPPTQGRSEGEE